MKRILLLVITILIVVFGASAQGKDKIKKSSSIPQKVHNTFSRHKKYKGYKIKHKHHGVTRKHKVDYKDGDVKNKTR